MKRNTIEEIGEILKAKVFDEMLVAVEGIYSAGFKFGWKTFDLVQIGPQLMSLTLQPSTWKLIEHGSQERGPAISFLIAITVLKNGQETRDRASQCD